MLIAGGGEGATLREVLRHPGVERAVMVDIDGELVDLCREHLAEMHQGAFDDPRAEVDHRRRAGLPARACEPFDAIVIDLTDPSEEGPIGELYSEGVLPAGRLAAGRGRDHGAPGVHVRAGPDGQWQDRIAETLRHGLPDRPPATAPRCRSSKIAGRS